MSRSKTIATLSLLLTLNGCSSKSIDYEPKTDLITSLGAEKAQEEFSALCVAAIQPEIKSVEFSPTGFSYVFVEFDAVNNLPTDQTNTVTYSEIVEVKVFENKRVIVKGLRARKRRDPKSTRLATLRFKTLEETKRWADLVGSLKAEAQQGS